eukprot:909242-Pyramimonas_sp.AAC.1
MLGPLRRLGGGRCADSGWFPGFTQVSAWPQSLSLLCNSAPFSPLRQANGAWRISKTPTASDSRPVPGGSACVVNREMSSGGERLHRGTLGQGTLGPS